MAQCYGNEKLEAHLHHGSQDSGEHALFFRSLTSTINPKQPRPALAGYRKKSKTLHWKIMSKTQWSSTWKVKQGTSFLQQCQRKSQPLIIRHAKLLIIDNKQLLHATQLVVWHHSSHYGTCLNRLPAGRKSVVQTDCRIGPSTFTIYSHHSQNLFHL